MTTHIQAYFAYIKDVDKEELEKEEKEEEKEEGEEVGYEYSKLFKFLRGEKIACSSHPWLRGPTADGPQATN